MKFNYEERKISFETIDLWLRNFQDEMNQIATASNDDEIINFLVIVDERDETAEVSIEKRVFNASINIRNYALGIIDDRYKIKLDKSRVGITQSYACGDSSCGTSKYGKVFAS